MFPSFDLKPWKILNSYLKQEIFLGCYTEHTLFSKLCTWSRSFSKIYRLGHGIRNLVGNPTWESVHHIGPEGRPWPPGTLGQDVAHVGGQRLPRPLGGDRGGVPSHGSQAGLDHVDRRRSLSRVSLVGRRRLGSRDWLRQHRYSWNVLQVVILKKYLQTDFMDFQHGFH